MFWGTADEERVIISLTEQVCSSRTSSAMMTSWLRVPKTELAKFFDVPHSNSICLIQKAGDS